MTAELVETAVSQLKGREDAADLHGLASGREGGQGTAVPTPEDQESQLFEKDWLEVFPSHAQRLVVSKKKRDDVQSSILGA